MSTTIDENALADYEALCAGATAGPWEIEREELGEDFDDEEQDTAFPMTIGPIQLWEHALDNLTDEHGAQVETDAAFIAQSRTMGPLLATKVREQAKEIERLQRLAREGCSGDLGHHWDKPRDETGDPVAHASRALWRDGALVPAPAAEGEEGAWVPLETLVRPEALDALARGLRTMKRGATMLVFVPRRTP